MEKGMAIIEVTDTGTKGFYIDQDVLEFARLNARTKKHLEDSQKAKKVADGSSRKAERCKAKRKAYTVKTAARVLLNFAICCGVTWAGWAGMIHPIISIPVSLFCLCTACLRLGVWLGKRGN